MKKSNAEHPRGYVLIIVLVVGLAASLAAISLSQTTGGALIGAVHSDDGDRSGNLADAGIMRAVAYLQAVTGNSQDFDSVLDRDLDSSCASPIVPDADDGTPDWTDGSVVQLDANGTNTKGFTCVTVPGAAGQPSGAYLVRFDDDDDDGQWKDDWIKVTGNNNTAPSNTNCNEGPHNDQSVDGTSNYYGGGNNSLRDRNRSIWVTVMGVYPATACTTASIQAANHRTVIRRLHAAPRFPSVAGIQVKGNINTQGSSTIAACSPIGSIEVDGAATGGGTGCGCGFSAADSWSGAWSHCTSGSVDCAANIAGVGDHAAFTLPGCLAGQIETPGPTVPDIPDPVAESGEYIDWGRSCTFYIDINGAASSGATQSLWFWDAQRRKDASTFCYEYEDQDPAPFPGPPDPSAAYGAGSNSTDWEGCWTPLLVNPTSDMGSTSWASLAGNTSDVGSWQVLQGGGLGMPYRAAGSGYGVTAGGNPNGEAGDATASYPAPTRLAWFPKNVAGEYTTCIDDGTSLDSDAATAEGNCGEQGYRCDAPGIGLAYDGSDCGGAGGPGMTVGPVNYMLNLHGINQFPDQVTLNKPNWQTACTVGYPPLNPTATYACSTCDGTNVAMAAKNSKHLWIYPQDGDDTSSVPAGVYWFNTSIDLSGGNYDTHENAHPADPTNGSSPDPEVNLANYILATLMSPGDLDIQPSGYFFGSGQTHNGDDERYFPSVIAGGDVTFRGGGGEALAGSVYGRGDVNWNGSGVMYLFGELYTNGNFDLGGGGEFYWLYRVSLQEPSTGTSGMPPTQFRSPY